MRKLILMLLLLFAGIPHALAQSAEPDRILITIADPGLSKAARSGPARPAYNRRSSLYLVSVNVRRAANKVADDFGLHVVDEWPIVPLRVHCLVYEVPEGTETEELLQRLRARPEIESAQRLNEFEVSATPQKDLADPFAGLQHNLDTLELSEAHLWSQGAGTRIAVIDTGADLGHPDLKTQIHEHYDFVTAKDDDFSSDAHGTAIASIIGAASNNGFGITGIAPAAEITLLRACWYRGHQAHAVCDSFTLAKALTQALDLKANIINLSLGGPADALLARLVRVAEERGVVVVAAAADTKQPGFPANVPGVLVVSSWPLDHDAPSPLSAPGQEILVAIPGGGFDYASGTSLSAAHVSGVVALLLAQSPNLQRDSIFQLLIGSQQSYGASVNACRALSNLLQRGGCRDMATANNDSAPASETDGDTHNEL